MQSASPAGSPAPTDTSSTAAPTFAPVILGSVTTSRGGCIVRTCTGSGIVTMALGPGGMLAASVSAHDVPHLVQMLIDAARAALALPGDPA